MTPQNEYRRGKDYCEWVLSMEEQDSLVKRGVLSFVKYKGGLYYYRVKESTSTLYSECSGILRYLDRFWILLPSSVQSQQLFWKRFYSLYSTEYLHMINPVHNLSCLCYFKSLLKEYYRLPLDFTLLDYGCGPGLSLKVFGASHLIGYDNNPEMLSQAKARGLSILSEKDYNKLPPNIFDGSIACYVLHMAIPETDIVKLAGLVKFGGVFVANYYKGIDAQRVTLILQRLGFTVRKIDGPERRFGSVYIYQKQ